MNDELVSQPETLAEAVPIEPAKPKAKRKPKKAAKGKRKVSRAPRTFNPAKLDGFGFRKGTIKSKAAAMYQAGATLNEVKAKVGSVQYNVLTELEAKGFKIKMTTVKGKGGRASTHYRILKGKR